METEPRKVFRKKTISSFLDGLTIPLSKQESGEEAMRADVKHEDKTMQLERKADRLWGMIVDDEEDRPAPLPTFGEAPKKEQARLVRLIGARMREARELTNMTQMEAAQRLGYGNSSKLAKVENATDTCSIPLPLVARAAKLFDVSTDFLFGLTTDWERDIAGEYNSFLLLQWEEARHRDLQIMERLYRRIRTVAAEIDGLVAGAREVAAALCAVRGRGGEFDDMPAGNRLKTAIERQAEAALHAERGLLRFRAELDGKVQPAD